MSRSALQRKEWLSRQTPCIPPPSSSIIKERTVKANEIPLHGNTRTFNLNSLLHTTILGCDYFKNL